MIQKIRNFIKTFIFVELGVGTARCIANYFEYKKYGQFMSAPLSVYILVPAVLTLIIIAVSFAVWYFLGKIIEKQNCNNKGEE